MSAALAFVTAFAAMEAVSYAVHRWIMHGPGMGWHASHHAPARGRFERNDLFPLVFSIPAVGLFATAAIGLTPAWTWWAAAGITLYGAAYLAIHELVIHGRVAVPVPRLRYLRWLRARHAAHHVDGGEPYGMLLPFVSPSRRPPQVRSGPVTLDEQLVRRASKRPMR
jgi:beta-carotene 3-hydroxylase